MKAHWKDLLELTKPRLSAMAIAMGILGFIMGSIHIGHFDGWQLFWLVLGLMCVGACSGAINMYMERDRDSKMERTKGRPIPSGRLTPDQVLMFGFIMGALGEVILLLFVNPVTAVLGALTLLFYLAIYTPSKVLNSASTLVGAVPGALPPLMGWTGACGVVTEEGFLLFVILFIWQIPHFLAIAWMHREDYRRADFPVLTVVDPQGQLTSLQMILYSIALCCVTLIPSFWGIFGMKYFSGALTLGLLFLALSLWVTVRRTIPSARLLFRYSILYLPLLGGFMIWDNF